MAITISIFLYLILFQGIKLNMINLSILSSVDEIFVFLFGFIFIFNIIKNKEILKEQLYLVLIVSLFSIVGLLSFFINSTGSLLDLLMSNILAIKFFLVIIAFFTFNFKFDIKSVIVKVIFNVEKIAIILGSVNFIFPMFYLKFFTFAERYTRFGLESITSCFNHPSTFGWFMLVCAIIHFTRYKYEDSKRDKIYAIVDIIFALCSFRTKIIIGVIVLFIVFEFIIQRNDIRKYLKAIALGTVIVVGIFITFRGVLENTYKLYFTSTQGTTARGALNDTGVKIMKDYFPLGVGFGKYGTWYASKNYSEYYSKYGISNIYGLKKGESKYATDTFWPAIMGETGAVGLVIYVLILGYIIKMLLSYNKIKQIKSNDKVFLASAILMLTLLIIESFGEASFNFSPKNIIAGLFIGISLNDYSKYKNGGIKQ